MAAMRNVPQPLTVDIVSDIVCPWCFIGKRHVEAALPTCPASGRSSSAGIRTSSTRTCLPRAWTASGYLEAKFGGPPRAEQIYARVRDAGERAGIAFDFDAIIRQPNTREAHRFVAWEQATATRTRWSSACSARTSSRVGI